jgi:hypothetical protein
MRTCAPRILSQLRHALEPRQIPLLVIILNPPCPFRKERQTDQTSSGEWSAHSMASASFRSASGSWGPANTRTLVSAPHTPRGRNLNLLDLISLQGVDALSFLHLIYVCILFDCFFACHSVQHTSHTRITYLTQMAAAHENAGACPRTVNSFEHSGRSFLSSLCVLAAFSLCFLYCSCTTSRECDLQSTYQA